jgi:hypothetical protein
VSEPTTQAGRDLHKTDHGDPCPYEPRCALVNDGPWGKAAILAVEAEARAAALAEREALELPGHKCRKVAEAQPLETGRELWLGELLEPYPGFEHLTHCLHVRTPQKSVVFGVYRGDFDLLAVFGYIVGGRYAITERWLSHMADIFGRAALAETPEETR